MPLSKETKLKNKYVIRAKLICIIRNSKWNLSLLGAYDKFPDLFRMGTFIDSTHMKL